MTEPQSNSNPMTANTPAKTATPLRCFTGALISAALAFGLYLLTTSIAQTFAAKPLYTDNMTAIKISIAVRTLVVGLTTLASGVFAISTLGLFGLGIQLWLKPPTAEKSEN
mgnify:CR=1 FL=1